MKPTKHTAAAAYEAWLADLPTEERVEVEAALADTTGWTNAALKARLEADTDYPAPQYGDTAFRGWRGRRGIQ